MDILSQQHRPSIQMGRLKGWQNPFGFQLFNSMDPGFRQFPGGWIVRLGIKNPAELVAATVVERPVVFGLPESLKEALVLLVFHGTYFSSWLKLMKGRNSERPSFRQNSRRWKPLRQ